MSRAARMSGVAAEGPIGARDERRLTLGETRSVGMEKA
jgi:hypothetical protein